MPAPRPATVEDLRRLPARQKAQLVDGRLVLMSPTGHAQGSAVMRIAASLMRYADQTGIGEALGDNVGFLVNLPHRESFSLDVTFHVGRFFGADFIGER